MDASTSLGDVDLAGIFAALPDATALFAADPPRFTVLAASDALLAVTQRPRQAVVGQPLAEAFPNASPADPHASGLSDLRASLVATVQSGATQQMERQRYDLQRPDGAWEERYWDVVNIPVRGPDGAVRYVLHKTTDVTAQVRNEAATVLAKRRAEGIIEHMGDAHCVLDREFRFQRVNAATERVLGLPRAALLGRSHWDVFPASVDAPVGRAFRRVVAEGIEQHFTHHYTGEGYDLHLEVDAYPTDEGGVAMFWRDVTERVRAEAALRESEEQYRALFKQMDEAYAVVEVMADAEGRWTDFLFLEVNDAFMRHTGMPYPVGRTATDLLGTPNPRWAELYGRAAETGESIRVQEPEVLLGRLFDLNIFRLGGEGSRRVAVLFTDITERRTAEDALRESERRYRLLFENIGEGFALAEMIWDEHGEPADWRYVEVNEAWGQTGVPASQTIGRTAREVNPEIEPYWLETYGRVVQTGQEVRYENYAKGFGKWFDTVAFKHSENRFGLVFRDVTERVRTEHEVNQNKERFRRALSIPSVGVLFFKLDGAILDGNAALERMTGYTLDELRALGNWSALTPPEFAEVTKRAAAEVAEHGRTAPYEKQWSRKDGSRMWGLFAPTRLSGSGRDSECVEFIVDITPTKTAEAALRTSEARFRALVTASSDITYQMSPDWSTMRALDGRGFMDDGGNASGSWLEQYIHPEDRPAVLAAVREAVRSKRAFWLEHRVRRSNGTFGWVLSRAVPLLDEAGEIVEWFGAASDVTARRQAEDALRRADRAKDEFLAMLGHELRNPLAPMVTGLALLERDGFSAELVPELTAMMKRQVGHLQRLVDDLLDVSRITRDKLTLKRVPLRVRMPLEAAVEQVRAFVQKRKHELHLQFSHADPLVEGDLERLTQVFANLLHNAAKFMSRGGTIWVQTAVEEGSAVVRVRDTGFGIAADDVDKLFELFTQIPQHQQQNASGGLGIGLALAQRLVRMHGGVIEARSEGPGRGSEFVVRLPICASESLQRETKRTDAQLGPRRRILIVDDNLDAAATLQLMLKLAGHEIQTAPDGQTALDEFASFQPEIVLLDLGLPGMDGIEVARRIRATEAGASVRLIAVTGWGQAEARERTREAGFDAHFAKPVNEAQLMTVIQASGS